MCVLVGGWGFVNVEFHKVCARMYHMTNFIIWEASKKHANISAVANTQLESKAEGILEKL